MNHAPHTMLAVIAALLIACSSKELDIENHPAFRVDEIPTPYNTLLVSAFNIQVLGVTKMGKSDVVECLKKVSNCLSFRYRIVISSETNTYLALLLFRAEKRVSLTLCIEVDKKHGNSTDPVPTERIQMNPTFRNTISTADVQFKYISSRTY
jgi:hypothetical protein